MFTQIKQVFKEILYKKLKIPYSSLGIPTSLLGYIHKGQPIVLVDIGAYDGSFTESLEKYCGISKGVLVEPIPKKAKQLIQKFNAKKYFVFPCALSDSTSQAKFEINEAGFTSSLLRIKREIKEFNGIRIGDTEIIDCETFTLDDIINKTSIENIDLIKMDVQGAEHLVIKGSQKSLKKTKMVWTEFSFKPLYDCSSTFIDIYNLLNESGFKLVEIADGFRSPNGELLQGDALFVNSQFLESVGGLSEV